MSTFIYMQICSIALTGVALAMGITVIVMRTVDSPELSSGVSMLGLGLDALALASFQE